MRHISWLIAALVFFMPAAALSSDHQSDPTYPVESLQEDLDQLWDHLQKEHPALFVFTDEEDFASLRDSLRTAIDRPLTAAEFFLSAAPLVARVGCGHTRLITPEGFWDDHPDRFFPLELRQLPGGIFVLADHGGAGDIPAGSQILSIDGCGAGEIFAGLNDLVTSDGFNETTRHIRVGLKFPYLLALAHGFPTTYAVEFRAPGQTAVGRARLPAVSIDTFTAGQEKLLAADPTGDRYLDLDLLADGRVARLTIRSFGFYDRVEYFHAFIDSSMSVIRDAGIDRLILDVRTNDGGDPWCSVRLYSYLLREPAPYFVEDYGSYAPLAKPIEPAEHPYTGELYVLTDGQCFSTTGHLCSLLKYHKIGVFVGEETGGTYTCNDASHVVTLDNTGLRLNLPRYSFATAVEGIERGKGLQPDHHVVTNETDLAAGRDTVLEYALDLATRPRE